MTEQTIRTQMLLGEAALARLRGSRVAVLGLGGVGSWTLRSASRRRPSWLRACTTLTPPSPSMHAPSATRRRRGSGFSTRSMITSPIALISCPVRWI